MSGRDSGELVILFSRGARLEHPVKPPLIQEVGGRISIPCASATSRKGKGGGEMLSMTSRLGASKMFADLAREVEPVNPDLRKLAEVGARYGLKVAD